MRAGTLSSGHDEREGFRGSYTPLPGSRPWMPSWFGHLLTSSWTFFPPTGLSPWDSWQGLCPHFSASEDPSPPSTPTLQQTSITSKTLINMVTMSNVFMGSPQRRVPFHSHNIFQLTKFSLICVILHNPDCKCIYRLSYSFIDQNGRQSMASSMQCHQGYRMDWHPGLTWDTALRSPSHQGWYRSDVETNMRENSFLWASKAIAIAILYPLMILHSNKDAWGEWERRGREDGGKTEKGNQLTLQLHEPVFALLPDIRVPSTPHFQDSGPWDVYALVQ